MLGGGAIGREVLKHVAGDPSLSITHVLELPAGREALQRLLGAGTQVIGSLDEMKEKPDLVLECAGHGAVKAHVPLLLRRGIDVLLVSVGSLSDPGLPEALAAAAAEGHAQLTLISGAIAGIDAIAAAKVGGLDEVIYTGRKPPLGWLDSPAEKICDLRSLREATVIFQGSAGEAARLYPKNANVAATVSLAGLGLEKTRATLIADPAVTKNIHHVRALGAFGELEITISGRPLADNPKTSALAAYSAVRALRNRVAAVCI
ncbi:MAG: aspartate dehydrogenase [Betaproteobacteria bacterium]|nr:aspartate dehydrogenase [Betaproteobacteria bacterium]